MDLETKGSETAAPAGGRHAHNHHGGDLPLPPNEIAVVGRPGSGKSTLIAAVARELAPGRRVAWVGTGGGSLAGERTAGEAQRGGSPPAGGSFALVVNEDLDRWNEYDLCNDAEILLLEGDRRPVLPKIAVVDREGEILREIAGGKLEGVVAFALRDDLAPAVARAARAQAGELPLFDARESSSIASFVVAFLEQRARSVLLYGLVLGGGKSARMKRDKAAIAYRGIPQVRYAYSMLERLCDRVFVSNRSEQAADPLFEGLEQIHDRFLEIGPMGGILSAFHAHPDAAWIVLGCDLPFVDEATLSELIAQRDPLKLATCYDSSHDGLPEPLCALYEPRYRRRLHQFLADGRDCPRKALINSRVKHLTLANPSALDNINNPQEYAEAVARLQREDHNGR